MVSQQVDGWNPTPLQRWWDRRRMEEKEEEPFGWWDRKWKETLKEDGGEEEESGAEYLDTETEKGGWTTRVFSNYNADGEWLDFSSTPQAPSGGMSYLVADRTKGKEKAEWEKVHVRLLQRLQRTRSTFAACCRNGEKRWS